MSEGAMTGNAYGITTAFLRRVVDTLLPGLPATQHFSALPAASQLGLDEKMMGYLDTHSDAARFAGVVEAIAKQAGGASDFTDGEESAVIGTLKAVEIAMSADFLAFLFVLAADYYESEEVLDAFGWRVTPPQPLGYELPPFDWALLASVRGRARPLWRSVDTRD